MEKPTIEQQLAELTERVNHQDSLHRHIGEDGNVRHFYNMLPMIIVAAVAGAITGIAIYHWLRPKN